MPAFLSDEWIAALDAAAKADGELREAAAEVDAVVQQVVRDPAAPGGEVAWALVLTAGEVAVRAGRVDEPTVTFTQDRPVAEAIAEGRLAAQQAFIDGDLQVGGDLGSVAGRHRVLAQLPDVFAAARG